MLDFLTSLFSHVCGQHAAHTWVVGGLMLPCCQRCVGLYAGAALAIFLQWRYQPRVTPRYLWIHALLLLQMAPQGLHLVPQNPFLRSLSGQLFSFSVVAFLWLIPGPKLFPHTELHRTRPSFGYWLGLVLSLPVIHILVAFDTPMAASLLSGLVALGGCGLGALVLIHLALGGMTVLRRFLAPGKLSGHYE